MRSSLKMVDGCVLESTGLAHAPLLAELHGRIFPEGWCEQSMRDVLAMPGAFGFIAQDSGFPSGFVLALYAGDVVDIISIGVLEQHQRRGIATRLLSQVAYIAKTVGASSILLEVARDNEGATGFYLSSGFEQISTRKNYYKAADGTRQDALVLSRFTDAE